jgi:Spy/CpxP family protein refolding chaperone
MNTKSKILSYAAAAILVLFFTSTASAQWFGRNGEKGQKPDEGGFENIARELNLTESQKQQMAQQRTKEKEQGRVLREEMKAVRDELTKELDKDKPDRVRISSIISQMKELIGRRIEQRVEGILSMKQVLTPEQFKKLNEKTKRFERPKRGGRHEKDSRSGFNGHRIGHGCKCPKFCERLG